MNLENKKGVYMATLIQSRGASAGWRDYLELTKPRVVLATNVAETSLTVPGNRGWCC